MRSNLLIVVLLSAVAFPALAGDYSSRTHFYAIEYLKPNKGSGDVSIINMTFNRAVDSKTAERMLREELSRAIALFPPQGDVMAYAWTQTSADLGSEKMVSLPDASHFLIYSQKAKQIQTERQYDAALQKPLEMGKGLKIEISLELEKASDGRARIVGHTNLPSHMKLMLDLRAMDGSYFAQDSIEVVDGRITSAWFSDKGRPLRFGLYDISVSSPLPSLQPSSVRSMIGSNGENLAGSVRTWMGSKMVDFTTKQKLP